MKYNPMFTYVNVLLFAILSLVSITSDTTTFFGYYLFGFIIAETAYLTACAMSKPTATRI